MKSKKGFIQIPILIAIVIGILALGGVTYIGIQQRQIKEAVKVKNQELPRVESLEELPSEVAEQPNTQTPTISPTNNKKAPLPQEEENVWQYVVEGYAADAEWFKRKMETVKSGVEIRDMQSRRDDLAVLLGNIRGTPFL